MAILAITPEITPVMETEMEDITTGQAIK
jgi:hypothetical protein